MTTNTVTIDPAALEASFENSLAAMASARRNEYSQAFDVAHDRAEQIGAAIFDAVRAQAARIAALEEAIYNAQNEIFRAEKALICTDLCSALGHYNSCAWVHDKANACNCGGIK